MLQPMDIMNSSYLPGRLISIPSKDEIPKTVGFQI